MNGSKYGFIGRAALVVTVLAVAFLGSLPIPAGASTQPTSPSIPEQVIFSFRHGDGNDPSDLISDASGNLYGTAYGGAAKSGVVLELSPQEGGGWSFAALHTFGLTSGDGTYPAGGLLTMDAAGNLYGATSRGGTGCSSPYSCGTIFKLSPQAGGGSWTEKILYNFRFGDTDGADPNGSLIFDPAGNLYGTTFAGVGTQGGGTVFELSPQSGGNWQETILYTFADVRNGYEPFTGVTLDASGNLYGTTAYGGASPCSGNSCGTVFELSPQSGGGWAERVLHTFSDSISSGANGPVSGVILDAAGNLYGVTPYGGHTPCFGYGCGTVFELSPESGGNWSKRDIYKFTGSPQDGQAPSGGLMFDPAGNLWGATQYGGLDSSGTVFELLPQSGGNWKEKIRHNFKYGTHDGQQPSGPLVFDPIGNLYGATQKGGTAKGGTIFELTP